MFAKPRRPMPANYDFPFMFFPTEAMKAPRERAEEAVWLAVLERRQLIDSIVDLKAVSPETVEAIRSLERSILVLERAAESESKILSERRGPDNRAEAARQYRDYEAKRKADADSEEREERGV